MGHRFPAHSGPPLARAPSAPASTRGNSIRWEGRLPPRPERSGVLTMCPEVAGVGSPERLPDWRSVWSAPACGRFCRATRRLDPYCPALIFQARSTPDPFVAYPTTFTLRWPACTPGPGWTYPNRPQGPEDSKALVADLFPPQPRRWPPPGRKPKPAPSRQVPFQRA